MLAFDVLIMIITIVVILIQSASATPDDSSKNANKIDQDSSYDIDTTNLSNNIGHSELPQLMSYGNNVYVVWIDDTSGKRNIYFKRSTDNGCTFGPTMELGNQKGGSIDPKMAVSGNNVYVLWEHTPGNNGGIFFTRSTDNGGTFSSIKNLGNNTGLNGFPQIAVSGNNVFVAWRDATHGIFFTRSTDNGGTFGNPVILYKVKNEGIGSKVFGPRITAYPRSDNVYVVWHSGDIKQHARVKALISDAQYIRSTDNGATFGNVVNLSNYSGSSVNPQIAVSQNNVYAVWTNNFQEKYGQVFLTRSTDNGATFGDIVNLSNYSGSSVNPQIAVSQNNVYAVWTNNFQEKYGQVFLTRSTDNGATFGDIVNLSNYSGSSVNPQIAVSQNNVYAVWTNNVTGNEDIFFKKDVSNNNNCIPSNTANRSDDLDNSKTVGEVKSLKAKNIAIVEDTFTQAAYDKSFYMFYEIYYPYIKNTDTPSNFTKYTDLLSSRLTENSKNSSGTRQIVNHLKWLTPKSTIDVLGDEDVHNGSSLFRANGTNVYDVIMLDHLEYVSQQEYDNLKRFVANGGILMLLAGNMFYAEVEYDQNTDTIRLVNGHDFAFNGKTAGKGDRERWERETSEWVGSNYKCCFSDEFIFRNDPFGITHVEEQAITNPKAKILLDYNATINKPDPGKFVIATYELEYKKGKVITLGLYTVNKLFENERFLRFFDSLLFQYALGDLGKNQ
jgi:N,N-dimethylformamidase beta subunit-like protein